MSIIYAEVFFYSSPVCDGNRSLRPSSMVKRDKKRRNSVPQIMFEEVIASSLELTDETGRLLSPPFRVLLPPEVEISIASTVSSEEYVLQTQSTSLIAILCSPLNFFDKTCDVMGLNSFSKTVNQIIL